MERHRGPLPQELMPLPSSDRQSPLEWTHLVDVANTFENERNTHYSKEGASVVRPAASSSPFLTISVFVLRLQSRGVMCSGTRTTGAVERPARCSLTSSCRPFLCRDPHPGSETSSSLMLGVCSLFITFIFSQRGSHRAGEKGDQTRSHGQDAPGGPEEGVKYWFKSNEV